MELKKLLEKLNVADIEIYIKHGDGDISAVKGAEYIFVKEEKGIPKIGLALTQDYQKQIHFIPQSMIDRVLNNQ
jgi:hypothetical protein